MRSAKEVLAEGVLGGVLAAGLSAAVVMIAGRRDSGSAVAPVNAVSHWMWGDEAAEDETVNVRHTGVGVVTHVLSAAFWATLHAVLRPEAPKEDRVAAAFAGGVVTCAVAAVVDCGLMPKRLTPGFEERLSKASTVAAFAAIAIGVAAGATLMDRQRR